ncbi:YicC family protein [Salinibacter sp. 10B]|uniref:YicC/YloC family endoribonuclease n=1 Tax=Salinibacter sp. 10B TaxID=1923971 RepID=UPI000CF50A98|nr:YicC/YloC family endoribonuclease [Salinibacter sp. 10B]PQJ34869.1 YicC family protein [Salinibacter sp. 10B]
MIRSMTGFGHGRASGEGATASVELRSTNKRHLNVYVHLPDPMAEAEAEVRSRIQDAFERGQFDVDVSVEQADAEALPDAIDADAAMRYKQRLEQLSAAAQIKEPVRLDHLLQFEDIFAAEEEFEAAKIQRAWPLVLEALDAAIEDLQQMRADEGTALQDDLEQRTHAIDEHLNAIEERAPERVEERQARLRERLEELIEDDRVDSDRIETEIAMLADKLDVTEECVRLHSHLKMFREALDSDDPSGRKLKFITQEIHREANTIGAKADDEVISRHAVDMKEEIEKIKEQIRNVE